MISAVIVAYNEAEKLKVCLQNIVSWADEVVVIDLTSTDNTKKVVLSFGCRLVTHPYVANVELVRNFAIKQCQGNWILVLDPDETVPNTLKKFLLHYAQHHKKGILNIPRMNIFFGEWIQYTNFWPDCQIRFFSKNAVEWRENIHSYPEVKLPVTKLPLTRRYAIRHTGYTTFHDFVDRQNRYSTIRAQERYSAGERFSLWSLFWFPLKEFILRFIKHRGFLDKERGLFLVLGLMFYHGAVEWKLWELEKNTQLLPKE